IVEEQHEAPAADRRIEHVIELTSRLLYDADRTGGRCRYDAGIAQRREWHPPQTVRELVGGFGDRLKRKARLPGATRPGERDQTNIRTPHELDHLTHLGSATQKPGRRNRQVRPVQGFQRWKLARTELEHTLLRGEILEPMHPEIEQHALLGKLRR